MIRLRIVMVAALFAFMCCLAAGAQASPTASPLYEVKDSLSGVSYTIAEKVYGPYEEPLSSPFFSSSYKSWLLPILKEGKLVLVVNGKEQSFDFSARMAMDFKISDDGTRYMGKLELEAAKPGDEPVQMLVADGKSYGPFSYLEIREFGNWAIAVGEVKDKGKVLGRSVIVAGKVFGPYEEVWELGEGSAGGHPIAIGTKKGRMYLVAQGKESGPYDKINLMRTREGKPMGIYTSIGGNHEFTVGDKKYGPYQQIGRIWNSEDGSSVAFEAYRKDQAYLVVNGKETAVEWVDIMSESGSLLYIASLRGRSFIVDGTREYGPYQNVWARYNPDGGIWAAEVEVNSASVSARMIVTAIGEFRGQDLRFDGTDYTWIDVDADGKARLMRLKALK